MLPEPVRLCDLCGEQATKRLSQRLGNLFAVSQGVDLCDCTDADHRWVQAHWDGTTLAPALYDPAQFVERLDLYTDWLAWKRASANHQQILDALTKIPPSTLARFHPKSEVGYLRDNPHVAFQDVDPNRKPAIEERWETLIIELGDIFNVPHATENPEGLLSAIQERHRHEH